MAIDTANDTQELGAIDLVSQYMEVLTLDSFKEVFQPELDAINNYKEIVTSSWRLDGELDQMIGWMRNREQFDSRLPWEVREVTFMFRGRIADGKLFADKEDAMISYDIKFKVGANSSYKAAALRITRYITGEIDRDQLEKELHKLVITSAKSSLREFLIGTPRLRDILDGKTSASFYNEDQLMDAISATPQTFFRETLRADQTLIDERIPDWPHLMVLWTCRNRRFVDNQLDSILKHHDRLTKHDIDALHRCDIFINRFLGSNAFYRGNLNGFPLDVTLLSRIALGRLKDEANSSSPVQITYSIEARESQFYSRDDKHVDVRAKYSHPSTQDTLSSHLLEEDIKKVSLLRFNGNTGVRMHTPRGCWENDTMVYTDRAQYFLPDLQIENPVDLVRRSGSWGYSYAKVFHALLDWYGLIYSTNYSPKSVDFYRQAFFNDEDELANAVVPSPDLNQIKDQLVQNWQALSSVYEMNGSKPIELDEAKLANFFEKVQVITHLDVFNIEEQINTGEHSFAIASYKTVDIV